VRLSAARTIPVIDFDAVVSPASKSNAAQAIRDVAIAAALPPSIGFLSVQSACGTPRFLFK
jgi:hypothetical protein